MKGFQAVKIVFSKVQQIGALRCDRGVIVLFVFGRVMSLFKEQKKNHDNQPI